MRVAVVAGIVVPDDAMSAAVANQAATLGNIAEVTSVDVLAQYISRPVPAPTHQVGRSWELLKHEAIRQADFIIFHWGIYYELVSSATLLRADPTKCIAVHFHNCSPADLVPPGDRSNIERSIEQIHHVIDLGVALWTYSDFNRQTLLAWGAEPSSIADVPFPIPIVRSESKWPTSRSLQILTVGRFVPAKGVHVLVAAVAMLNTELRGRVRVVLAGNAAFSDAPYLREIEAQIADEQLADTIRIVLNPNDSELAVLFEQADVLVSPSFHEGLCVPVIEAYAHGCRAIGTDAANLPYLMTEEDSVVACGDAAALSHAILDELAKGKKHTRTPVGRRREIVERYSESAAQRALRSALLADVRCFAADVPCEMRPG